MTVRQVWVLRGPNIWARVPVLEAMLQRDRSEPNLAAMNPAFSDRVPELVSALTRTRRCQRKPVGLLELTEGTAESVARLALALQSVGEPVLDFWKAWDQTEEEGVSKVVVQFREEAMGRAALEAACEMSHAFSNNLPFNVDGEVERLNDLAYDVLLGPSTQAIVDAARARGIPWNRLNEANLVMFGQGAKQRRILTAETDRTGAIAEAIAKDKELTRSMLRAVGVPVSEGRPATSPEDAWEAAEELEGPVVVKPRDGNHGRGVALNLTTREQVVAAYEAALKEGEGVLVERFAPGSDHRLLVVGNSVVAAARREPPSVVGDGEATIARLIDRANDDPLRGDGFITPLKVIAIDEDAVALLAEHDFRPDSVPPSGVRVQVGRKINFFNGGLAIDVTERLHPEVAARAVEAARVVGLDVAGLDVVALDVARPLEEQGGVVVEVNAGPGLQMHLYPSASPRPVGESIIEHMFPEGEDGQIPIVAVTGTLGATLTSRLIAHILRNDGRRVGLACSEGIEFEGRRIKTGDCSGPQGARTLLLNPLAEAAVCETSPEGVLKSGLGFDQCSIAVILDQADGSLELRQRKELGPVERTVVESVKRWGGTVVLNADDPRASSVVNTGSVPVTFFSRDAENPLVVQSRAGGGSAVVVRHGSIVVATRDSEEPIIDLHRLPMIGPRGNGFRVEDALAGAAAAFALSASREAIRIGLETFVAAPLEVKNAAKETTA